MTAVPGRALRPRRGLQFAGGLNAGQRVLGAIAGLELGELAAVSAA